MPASTPTLESRQAAEHVLARCFRPSRECLVGVELELLPVASDGRRADHQVVAEAVAALDPFPGGSALSFEPGGQVELSTLALPGAGEACAALGNDLEVLARALADRDVTLVGLGLDPSPNPRRVIRSPRYDAMAAYFDRQGPHGRTMMYATASIQVNLDCAGPPTLRWGLVHALGPALAASFANSPFTGEGPSGWKSTRLATWQRIDPSRTAPASRPGQSQEAYVEYAVSARVMLVRRSPEALVPVHDPLTFRQWMAAGHKLGFPTLDDLDYHLTTLFPPVRPRGWLELRMADTLPSPWWQVPVAVMTALAYDQEAAERAAFAVRGTAGLWVDAARYGLEQPDLARAARACFRAAVDAFPRMGIGTGVADVVDAYVERYVERARCPADDRLDAWAATGATLVAGHEMVA